MVQLSSYCLYRDGIKVFSAQGYQETVDRVETLQMEMIDGVLKLRANGESIGEYSEEQTAPVVNVSIWSRGKAKVYYSEANAYVPTNR